MEFVLDEVFDEVSAEDLTLMMMAAGSRGHTAALQWLLQRGAEWPKQLSWQFKHHWPNDTVAWAAQQGCPAAIELQQRSANGLARSVQRPLLGVSRNAAGEMQAVYMGLLASVLMQQQQLKQRQTLATHCRYTQQSLIVCCTDALASV
jgi:hypothetical protein